MKPHERISSTLSKFESSFTLGLKALADDRRSEGKPVFDFGLGETKGDLPEPIKEAGIDAFMNQKTMYAPTAGILELREEILRWLSVEPHYDPDCVIVTNGAKQSLMNVFMAILNPGDAVLLEPAPWVSYMPALAAAHACPIPIQPRQDNLGKVTPQDLERYLAGRPDVKMFLVNTPCNPTAQIYEPNELQGLLDVCVENEIYFVLDRLYWRCVFDGKTFPEPRIDFTTKPWLITVDGLSKNWRRTGGIRIGWTVGPKDVSTAMKNIQSHLNAGPAVPAQWAALAAISGDYDREMVDSYEKKRNLLQQEAKEMPLVEIWPSPATFYSYWDVTGCFGKRTPQGKTINTSDDVSSYLIDTEGVITASGNAFLQNGFLRLSFTLEDDEIAAGMAGARRAFLALG